ncbi:MAG: methylenetetrahydrofolate reductase [Gammaproteobacteria bacterium]
MPEPGNQANMITVNVRESDMSVTAQASSQDQKREIMDFVSDYSIEILPRDRALVATMPAFLSPGTSVSIGNPPSATISQVIEVAADIRRAGFNPVPHLLAREIPSKGHLQQTLEDLREAGVEQLLLIAGDKHSPSGPFNSTMELLETGLFEQYDFNKIGVAGHPEGSPYAGPNLLGKALSIKNNYAERSGTEMYILTQISFDAAHIINWSKIIADAGNRLPIHIGMAGPTRLRTLLHYGAKCGIGPSLRTLMKKATALANLITISTPDELIRSLTEYRRLKPGCPIVKVHFFSFAGFEKTALWANAVAGGQFRITSDGKGFEVDTPA